MEVNSDPRGVQDMLADAVQQVVHRKGFQAMGGEQDIVGEQSSFFDSAEARENLAGRSSHRLIMSLVHEWTNGL